MARKKAKLDIVDAITEADLVWLQHRAVILKVAGNTAHEISEVLGVTKRMVRRWFEDDLIQAKIAELRKDIASGAITYIKDSLVEAADLMMKNARAAYAAGAYSDSIRASAELLDRGGLAKVNKSESRVKNESEVTFSGTEEFFDKFSSLPIETQREIADHMAEVEQLVAASKGTG